MSASEMPIGSTIQLRFGVDGCTDKKSGCVQGHVHDMEKITIVMSSVDNSMTSYTMKVLFQLDKFSFKAQRPRSILVKFVHWVDASSVLSNAYLVS